MKKVVILDQYEFESMEIDIQSKIKKIDNLILEKEDLNKTIDKLNQRIVSLQKELEQKTETKTAEESNKECETLAETLLNFKSENAKLRAENINLLCDNIKVQEEFNAYRLKKL